MRKYHLSHLIIRLSADGNDVERAGTVELLRRFKEALEKIRVRGIAPKMCVILARREAV